MLRRAENVTITHDVGVRPDRGWCIVAVGRKRYRVEELTAREYADLAARQREVPVSLGRLGERTCWRFRDEFFWDDEDLGADRVHALLVARRPGGRHPAEGARVVVAPRAPRPRVDSRRETVLDAAAGPAGPAAAVSAGGATLAQ